MLPTIRYFNITEIFLPMGILPSAGGKKNVSSGGIIFFQDMLTNSALAETLQKISENGSFVFYGVGKIKEFFFTPYFLGGNWGNYSE